METLALAFALVFLAELGDKTQLLTLLLAARWGRTLPIATGLALASALSHLGAALFGAALGGLLAPGTARLTAGLAFLGCAAWMLRPEGEEGEATAPPPPQLWRMTLAAFGVYLLAELGDKTQLASAVLALKQDSVPAVAGGATLAMLAANLPVLWLGARLAGRLPRRTLRLSAALLFAAVGVLLLAAP